MVDARHYNARYVLEMLYFCQEKFECSEYDFRMAFRITPISFVSSKCVALMSLYKQEHVCNYSLLSYSLTPPIVIKQLAVAAGYVDRKINMQFDDNFRYVRLFICGIALIL